MLKQCTVSIEYEKNGDTVDFALPNALDLAREGEKNVVEGYS